MAEEALAEDSNSQNANSKSEKAGIPAGGILTLVSISKQPGRKNKRKLTFSDNSSLIVLQDIVKEHRLYQGQVVDARTKSKLIVQSRRLEIQKKALLLLSRRPHSYWQIKTKLERKNFPKQDITYVLDDLEKQGILNDREFSRMWMDFRIKKRSEGRFSLFAGLMRTGVARKIAEDAVGIYSEQEEYKNLIKLLEKIQMQKHDNPEKIIRKLKTRGFPHNLILKALKQKKILT
jgi:regulatory protein